MTSQPTTEVPRDEQSSRGTRGAAAVAVLVKHPHVHGVRGAGAVLAECALGFA